VCSEGAVLDYECGRRLVQNRTAGSADLSGNSIRRESAVGGLKMAPRNAGNRATPGLRAGGLIVGERHLFNSNETAFIQDAPAKARRARSETIGDRQVGDGHTCLRDVNDAAGAIAADGQFI